MFSARFHWNFSPNRISLLLAAKRGLGERILDLTESNPTHAGLEYPGEIPAIFSDRAILTYDPAPAGSITARAAVASYYRARSVEVDPGRILLTASTSEAYAYLFKLLADPGDNVLVPRPSYPLFDYLARMEAIEARRYPLACHDGWAIEPEAIEQAMTSRTRAVVVVNPNNPTGSFLKRHELSALAALCARRDVALISDEVFADYAFAPDPQRAETVATVEECLAFALSGLSKVAGLPQMKLGWIVASGPRREALEAMEKLEWIADTYLSVSTPVQCAAGRLLAAGEAVQRQIRERTRRNLAFARVALEGSAAGILPVEGGWYATIRMPRTRSEEEWTLELLERRNVLVQPGFFYDFETEAFLIVSLLTEPSQFEEGLASLKELAA